MGSILFNILTHKHLFPGTTNEAVLRENKHGDVRHVPYYLDSTLKEGCSPQLESLIMSLLASDCLTRPTAREALQHPWFFTNDCGIEESDLSKPIRECLLWNDRMS